MKIVVCLKEVASREARYQIDSAQSWIEEASTSFEINECDEYALEEALKLREAHGGEVILVTIGPERAERIMRKALAKGADRGILVIDEQRLVKSPYLIAAALHEAISGEDFDLVLTGTQSDDLGYAQTGPMLAELLSIPHVTLAMEIKVESPARVQVLREMESGWFQWIALHSPALISVQAGISSLRYASLKGIMQAKKKEIRKVEAAQLEIPLDTGPQIEIRRIYVPQSETTAQILDGDVDSALDQLIEKLQSVVKVL